MCLFSFNVFTYFYVNIGGVRFFKILKHFYFLEDEDKSELSVR